MSRLIAGFPGTHDVLYLAIGLESFVSSGLCSIELFG
jgi:hypothetical protein